MAHYFPTVFEIAASIADRGEAIRTVAAEFGLDPADGHAHVPADYLALTRDERIAALGQWAAPTAPETWTGSGTITAPTPMQTVGTND